MSAPLRALVATHYWSPHIGGIETVAAEQSARLARRGWELEVFTSRLRGPRVEQSCGAIVRRHRCINVQEDLLHVPVPLMSPTMLASMVRAGRRASVIVAHGHAYVGSAYAGLTARLLDLPLVLVQHNPFVDYPAPVAAIERTVDATLGRWLLHRSAAVVCVSSYTESYVRRIAPEARTTVVHSGVDTDRFSPSLGRRAGDRPIVLTVRRLVPRNGVDVLLRAWMATGLGSAADLVIAGEGAERAALTRLAGGDASVRFVGRVSDEALVDLYQQASVFVLPSVSGEGFGLVAAEALASGIPVVTTDAGATGELVRHGLDGLVVPARDPAALGAALRELLVPSTNARMTSAACSRHHELGWERSIDELEEVLRRIMRT